MNHVFCYRYYFIINEYSNLLINYHALYHFMFKKFLKKKQKINRTKLVFETFYYSVDLNDGQVYESENHLFVSTFP